MSAKIKHSVTVRDQYPWVKVALELSEIEDPVDRALIMRAVRTGAQDAVEELLEKGLLKSGTAEGY